MKTVARRNVRFAKARLKHRVHRGDCREDVWTRESQLECAITAAGDAYNDSRLADVEGGAELGNKIAGQE